MKEVLEASNKFIPLRLLIVCALFSPPELRADFKGACRDAYQHLVSGRTEPLTEGDLVVLFYPFHVEIAVLGQVYKANGGYEKSGSLVAHERASRSGLPYFAVPIRATAKELEKLSKFVGKNEPFLQSCVSGTCRALNRNLGIYIPPVVRWSPEFTLAYLSLMKGLNFDHGRLGRIEFRGRRLAGTLAFSITSLAIYGNPAMLMYLLFTKSDADRKGSPPMPESRSEESIEEVNSSREELPFPSR